MVGFAYQKIYGREIQNLPRFWMTESGSDSNDSRSRRTDPVHLADHNRHRQKLARFHPLAHAYCGAVVRLQDDDCLC